MKMKTKQKNKALNLIHYFFASCSNVSQAKISPAVISNLVVRTFEVVFGSTTTVVTFFLTAALSQGVDKTGEIAVELGALNGCPSTVTEFSENQNDS